jgi:hypothetical protein
VTQRIHAAGPGRSRALLHWLAPDAVSLAATGAAGTYRRCMGTDHPAELEGQISINELLDEPIGTEPIQLALPIHFHFPEASVRRAS